jgi:hypothetical protein
MLFSAKNANACIDEVQCRPSSAIVRLQASVGDLARFHLIAKKTSKHAHFDIVIMSLTPARFMTSIFAAVENGSKVPFKFLTDDVLFRKAFVELEISIDLYSVILKTGVRRPNLFK